MLNRLSQETSPYLLQHADNPVDWYPWGKEALDRAAREQKPIFLSIGYSACHWCHVMERESFTDPQVAEVLNRNFVSIKVDREERPDLDTIYMDAVTSLTGSGGWPLSVWLTPAAAPFYGGTYFPDRPRFGMPSFRQVLEAIAQAWADSRADLEQTARTLIDHLTRGHAAEEEIAPAGGEAIAAMQLRERSPIDVRWRDRTIQGLRRSFDWCNGGWGTAPKFPQPLLLQYLLADYALNRRPEVRQQFELALDRMAAGGIYDHLGGGFHRYSTDERWLVPHFEKMLYDNALLATCYLRGWQLTGMPRYREVVEETLDYVLREMTSPEGGFFSTQDADSEGEEGKFFVWSREEVEAALGSDAELFCRTYGVTVRGNFEGRNVLSLLEPADDPQEISVLKRARARLLAVRQLRVPPGRDEKVLAAWNGLMLASLAEAACVLRSERYLEAARRCGEFLLGKMMANGDRLVRSWKAGVPGSNGYLEDYADTCHGFLALYQATFDERWFLAARGLADSVILHFLSPAGGFFDTSDDHEVLITRPRSLQDNATPSGNSMAATVFLRLAVLTGEGRYWDLADGAIRATQSLFDRAPVGLGQWLQAKQLLMEDLRQVAVVGQPYAQGTRALLQVVFATHRPTVVIGGRAPGASSAVPMLEGKEPMSGPQGIKATAWVCAGTSCSAPTTEPQELRATLDEGRIPAGARPSH